MGWATHAIETLKTGSAVTIKPRGHSMTPIVKDGSIVVVDPDTSSLQKGDVVLCKVNGKEYLHLVTAIGSDGRFQIGNAKGRINGWVGLNSIFGKATEVNGKQI